MIPPMTTLTIASTAALDSVVADLVRMQLRLTELEVRRDSELAEVEKRHQAKLMAVRDNIRATEENVQAYCKAHRAELFPETKSRETALAHFGFELTPWRVELASRRLKIRDVIQRLLRSAWGKVYLRQPDPQLDKEMILADRQTLTPERLAEAGLQITRDEQFFVRPKLETAEATSQAA